MTTVAPHRRRLHFVARAALSAGTALPVGAVLLLWAWNLLAVDLAGLPRIQFRHALAMELAAAVLLGLQALVQRWLRPVAMP
jgi:hypothetical protein